MDAFIKGLSGEVAMLVDTSVTRNRKVDDNETSITVTARGTPANAYAFNLIEPLASILYAGDEYCVLKPTLGLAGQTVTKTFTADHKAYDSLASSFVYTKYSSPDKVWQRDTMLGMIFTGSGYGYQIVGTLPTTWTTENQDDFWGWDNRSALLSDFCEKFIAEFQIRGSTFYIGKEVSSQTNAAFRYKVNIKDPTVDLDATNLLTYIKGYGHSYSDGTYAAQSEYTSPLSTKYGKREATPYIDDNAVDKATLDAALPGQLTDSINLTATLTHVEMEKQSGVGGVDVALGDYGYLIIEPFNLAVQARIIEIEDYNNNKPALYTFGTIQKKATDIMMSLAMGQSNLSNGLDKVGKIATTAYDSRIITTTVGEVDD